MSVTILMKRKFELENILKGKSHLQMVGSTTGYSVKPVKDLHEIRKELNEVNDLLNDLLFEDAA